MAYFGEDLARSFEGVVTVYKKEIYINTRNGIGVSLVIDAISPLIGGMARKFDLNGFSYEDKFNELVLMAIDGINSFNPSKGTKLSSFLHIHLHNRMVSMVKSDNKMGNDAVDYVGFNYGGSSEFRIARREVNFSSISYSKDDMDDRLWEPSGDDSICGATRTHREKIDASISLDEVCKTLDNNTANLITLVCDGHSVPTAASKLNMPARQARVLLKKLSSNSGVLELLKG